MEFDFETLGKKDRYKLLCAIVAPRPIALVTSISENGDRNVAPMSFFNVFGDAPPIVILGIQSRPNGSPKDTVENIRATGEFVVNSVDSAVAEAMVATSIEFPPDVDEAEMVGFGYEPSIKVRPGRIREAPAAMECRVERIVDYHNRAIVFGEVVQMHVRDNCIDPANLHIDNKTYQPLARLHGDFYVASDQQFELPKPTYEQWMAQHEP